MNWVSAFWLSIKCSMAIDSVLYTLRLFAVKWKYSNDHCEKTQALSAVEQQIKFVIAAKHIYQLYWTLCVEVCVEDVVVYACCTSCSCRYRPITRTCTAMYRKRHSVLTDFASLPSSHRFVSLSNTVGLSGLVVTCSTAMYEVPGSNPTVGCVSSKNTTL